MSDAQVRSLVLLPGLMNDARLWAGPMAELSGLAGITVGDLTVADSMSALADAVLAQVPEGRFALAGLSMGGYVAFEILRQAPERVAALALLDTTARPDSRESSENRRKLMLLADTDFAAVQRTLLPKLVHASRLDDPAVVEVIAAMAESAGKDTFKRQQRAILGRTDSRPTLGAIACPTLVLCGREDVITPVVVHEEIAAGIPGSRLTVVDNCGHLSALERPGAVSAALKQWLLDAAL